MILFSDDKQFYLLIIKKYFNKFLKMIGLIQFKLTTKHKLNKYINKDLQLLVSNLNNNKFK